MLEYAYASKRSDDVQGFYRPKVRIRGLQGYAVDFPGFPTENSKVGKLACETACSTSIVVGGSCFAWGDHEGSLYPIQGSLVMS